MRVSQFWIHKEMISREQFILASAMSDLSIPIVPFDLVYSHFGKCETTTDSASTNRVRALAAFAH